MPDFALLQARYPDIQLELIAGLAMANLTQREADVAVRIACHRTDLSGGTQGEAPNREGRGNQWIVLFLMRQFVLPRAILPLTGLHVSDKPRIPIRRSPKP